MGEEGDIGRAVRQRIIETLELAASFDEQIEYERAITVGWAAGEVVMSWEDSVPHGPAALAGRLEGFSDEEISAMEQFEPAWLAASEALPSWASVEQAQGLPEWSRMRDAAVAALAVFQTREPQADGA